jgi:L-alanine-DL-glutamate epimerase-like enolase superfamily enzyme
MKQPDTHIATTSFERHDLPLSESFTIARGTTETSAVVTVELTDEQGRVGVGAAGPSSYYGESAETVTDAMPALLDAVEDVGDPHLQQTIEQRLADVAPDAAAARAAVSIAVHDLTATQAGEPLYRRLGLDPARAPKTSYTVSIDDPEEMRDRARRLTDRGFDVLKVKLGTDADRERLGAVREGAPDARIRVDANGAWTAEEALANTTWLADHDVEFVEQPVPAGDVDGLRMVSVEGDVPVAADESCVTAQDVPTVADAVDIVVVKLMKCGGIRSATRQILTADAYGLDVMLGCMTESTASISGACHLSPMVEYADLDGALLLGSDVYEGVPVSGEGIDLGAVETGTGVR